MITQVSEKMTIYSVFFFHNPILYRVNVIHLARNLNNVYFPVFPRTFSGMSKTVVQNYVAVNIAEGQHAPAKIGFLRRLCSRAPKPDRKNKGKSGVGRLLDLAKTEKWSLVGAVCLLLVSSTVTMAVPFSLGKVLDIIYTGSANIEEARGKLNRLCGILIGVFAVGACANFGRVYLMSTAGEFYNKMSLNSA